jgi:hypothetical protein
MSNTSKKSQKKDAESQIMKFSMVHVTRFHSTGIISKGQINKEMIDVITEGGSKSKKLCNNSTIQPHCNL